MKQLPDSEIYEQELEYMPYRDSLEKVLQLVEEKVPQNSSLIDLMCGPGDLLGKISKRRTDLELSGLDIDLRYAIYAAKEYPWINFGRGDILEWKPTEKFDAIICTGALHHIPYERQEEVVEKMAKYLDSSGLCIISDCHIDNYSNEIERKLAAAKLGHEYLVETIKNGAPDQVIAATADLIYNDVMMAEFKTSLKDRLVVLKRHFKKIEVIKTWPKHKTEYGDYITVLGN